MKKLIVVLALIVTFTMLEAAFAEPIVFGDQKIDLYYLTREELNKLKSEVEAEITRNHDPSSSEEDEILRVTKEVVEYKFKQMGIEVSWPWFDYSYTQEWEHFTLSTRVDYRSDGKSNSDKIYSEVDRADGQFVLTYLKIGENVELDKRGSVSTTPKQAVSAETEYSASSSNETAAATTGTDAKGQYAKCITNNVNVRMTPEKNGRSIGQIKRGEIVYVYEYGEGDADTAWAHISTKVGDGYVLNKYLEETDQVDETLSTNSSEKSTEKREEKTEPKTTSLSTGDKEKDYKAKCKKLDYNKIERNPDSYKGQYAKVSGKVIQVSEGWFDSVTCRVSESGDKIWYVTYKHKEGEPRILEDDSVTFYGICEGVTTYTALFGNSITIPKLSAEYVTIK